MQPKWLCLLILALLTWPATAQQVRLSVNLPANGATVDRNFSLSGTATPGAIVQVDGSLRATGYADGNGYWTIPLNTGNMAAGQVMNLNVTARDQYGNRSNSVALSYAAGSGSGSNNNGNNGNGTSAIRVSVNSPTNGATIPRGRFVLTGTATPSMIVEATGSLRGSVYADRNGRFSLPLNSNRLNEGDVLDIAVVARDNAGRQSYPVNLRYAVGNQSTSGGGTNPNPGGGGTVNGLRVSVNSPGNGATVNGPFTLSGSATPWQRIVVQGDLSGEGQSDGNGNWSVQMNPNSLAAGQVFNLQVYAKDGAGNLSSPMSVRYAMGGSGNTGGGTVPSTGGPLQCSVNLPANGATVPSSFTLTGTATPGMLVECTGDLRGQTYADGSGNWSLTLSGGQAGSVVNLTVFAREGSGNRSREINLKYAISGQQGAAPQVVPADSSIQVAVASPAHGQGVGGPFSVSGTATASMIVEAKLLKDGQEVTHGGVYADRGGHYTIPLDPGGATGPLELVVTARDSYGHQSAPSRVPLNLGVASTPAPTPAAAPRQMAMSNVAFAVASPRNGDAVGSFFEVKGTAAPATPVDVTARVVGRSQVMRSSANADNQGSFTVPLMTSLAPGTPLDLAVKAGNNSNPVQMRVTVR